MEPSVSTILELMDDPELTHKGMGFAWFGAVFVCGINALMILFAGKHDTACQIFATKKPANFRLLVPKS